jgi:hypothetical protein
MYHSMSLPDSVPPTQIGCLDPDVPSALELVARVYSYNLIKYVGYTVGYVIKD